MSYEKLEYIIYDNGSAGYYNGKGFLHREDGPASISASSEEGYWLNGARVTKERWKALTRQKEMTVAEIEAALGYGVKVVK